MSIKRNVRSTLKNGTEKLKNSKMRRDCIKKQRRAATFRNTFGYHSSNRRTKPEVYFGTFELADDH